MLKRFVLLVIAFASLLSVKAQAEWKRFDRDEAVHLYCRYPLQSSDPVVIRLHKASVLILRPGDQFSCKLVYARKVRRQVASMPAYTKSWLRHGGKIEQVDPGVYEGRAPRRPGRYRWVWAKDSYMPYKFALHVIVMERFPVKAMEDFTYPDIFGEKLKPHVEKIAFRYLKPRYLFKMEREFKSLEVIPGYPLEKLVCRAFRGAERSTPYALLGRHFIEKVQALNDELIRRRYIERHVKVLSAFRHPEYNRSVGGAHYSRHIYGDAIDFIIDENNDGIMDDVNHDAKVDRHDGILIAKMIERLVEKHALMPGGIGVYELDKFNQKGVSLHMDARGTRARWGYSSRTKKLEEFDW